MRVLDIAPFDYPERDAVDAIVGDIRDPAAVAAAMQGVSDVVHCAMALPLSTADNIMTTGVDGTRLLLQQAAAGSVRRFVFISTTAVYGIPDHHPLLETDPVCQARQAVKL